MREIKFKFVVENHGGKYISREYTLDHNGLPDMEAILEDMEGPCNCPLNESVSVCEGGCQEFFDAKVIDKIQYTGLKDREKQEVYDGDILSLSYGIPPTTGRFIVEWRDDEVAGELPVPVCGWWLKSLGKEPSSPLSKCYESDIEVIGNIYENSELLKEVEK